jgi:hypothetical protein
VARRTFLSISVGVIISALSNTVAGQQMQGCQDHAQMVLHLKTKFHEERAEVGVNQYGWLIELFESANGETWTLVATRPGGLAACLEVS